MTVPHGSGDVGGAGPTDPEPPAFALAVASLRAARPRPEVRLTEVRPPQRLAPYAIAISGSVPPPGALSDDVDDLATGRLVVLHDPDGHESWNGVTRLVAYVRADLDPDMAGDPLLASVGWSWLREALEGSRCPVHRCRRHGHPGQLGELRRPRRATGHGRARGTGVVDPSGAGPDRPPGRLVRPAVLRGWSAPGHPRRRHAGRGSGPANLN